MGSTMRNVLMGIAGGMQGYQQAAKLEMDKEEQNLKNKLLEFQQKKIQSDLTQSGLEYENQAKMRLAIGDELKQTGTVRPETMMRFMNASKDAPVIAELLKMSQAAQKPILKPATSSLITRQGTELAPATMTGRPAVEGSRSDIVARLMKDKNDPIALRALALVKDMATNPTGTDAVLTKKILAENPEISSEDLNTQHANLKAKAAGTVLQGTLDVRTLPENIKKEAEITGAKAAATHAGQGLQGLTAATVALNQVKVLAEELKKTNASYLSTLGTVAGSEAGLGGRTARELGAPGVGLTLKSVQLPLIQHYESMYAGVRGASSPQLLQIMEPKMIQASDEPKLISDKIYYFENVFNALSEATKKAAKGELDREGIDAIVMKAILAPLGGSGKSNQPIARQPNASGVPLSNKILRIERGTVPRQ